MGPLFWNIELLVGDEWAHCPGGATIPSDTNGPIAPAMPSFHWTRMGPLPWQCHHSIGHEWAHCAGILDYSWGMNGPIASAVPSSRRTRMGPLLLQSNDPMEHEWAHCAEIVELLMGDEWAHCRSLTMITAILVMYPGGPAVHGIFTGPPRSRFNPVLPAR